MRTYWTTPEQLSAVDISELSSNPFAGFTRLGVADDVPGAVESLREFLRDATQPPPAEPPAIAFEVCDDAVLMTVFD